MINNINVYKEMQVLDIVNLIILIIISFDDFVGEIVIIFNYTSELKLCITLIFISIKINYNIELLVYYFVHKLRFHYYVLMFLTYLGIMYSL